MKEKVATPTWYDEPQSVFVRVARHISSSSADELVVSVQKPDGNTISALVPTKAVDVGKSVVYATVVGEVGSSLLVSLPAGSMGTASLLIEKASAKEVIADWKG